MRLIDVLSATATRLPNVFDLIIVADLGEGEQQYAFTQHVDDNDGLTPDIQAWLMSHPEFPLPAYVPPPPPGPADFPLTARQIRLGLIRNGVALSSVLNAIATLPTQPQRDEASVYWEFSAEVHWEHPMTQALLALVEVSQTDAAAWWMLAKDYQN